MIACTTHRSWTRMVRKKRATSSRTSKDLVNRDNWTVGNQRSPSLFGCENNSSANLHLTFQAQCEHSCSRKYLCLSSNQTAVCEAKNSKARGGCLKGGRKNASRPAYWFALEIQGLLDGIRLPKRFDQRDSEEASNSRIHLDNHHMDYETFITMGLVFWENHVVRGGARCASFPAGLSHLINNNVFCIAKR